METIVEIKYNNYTENVIMTNATAKELAKIAKTDKDYVSHKVIQQGAFAFPPVVKKVMNVGKINNDLKGRAISVYLFSISYAGKTVNITSWSPIDLIRKDSKRIVKGYQGHNCNNYQKKGYDY